MRTALNLLVLAVLFAACALPQASTGTIAGTVTDQSGGAIPNARVLLTNAATGILQTTRTNEAGFFLFAGVIPGSYHLVTEVPGMDKYEAKFNVQVEQRVVIDPVLKPGQTTTTVDVTDSAPLVAVDNPIVRVGMERKRIEQLPMDGRKIATLLNTLPGVETRRAFGAPTQAQEWIIDGSVSTDRRWDMNPIPLIPPVDSVEEFTVDANAVSAKHSRPVNVIVSTKSGTNQFHGSLFETLRNNSIGLARSRTDTFSKPPKLIRNEFGASGGGPVILPKLYNGRNRTFWFATYEGSRQIRSQTNGYNVPTEAMRNGDFSGLADSQGRSYVIYDPLSTDSRTGLRQPFAFGGKLNVIDPKRMSPVAKYLFSITPLPSNAVNPLVDYNFWQQVRWNADDYAVTGRLDHRLSDRDLFYARLSHERSNHLDDSGLQYLNNMQGYSQIDDGEKSAALHWVRTFSPVLFNDVLVSARRRIGGGHTKTDGTNWPNQFRLPNPFNSPTFPVFQNMGLSGYTIKGSGAGLANETYYVFDDNATRILGRHELQFGFHHRYDQINILPDQNNQPVIDYGTLATALYDVKSTPTAPQSTPYTGSNLANMFLGVSTYSNSMIRSWYYLRGGETALYFQDNYKLTRRLNLNLGLRWEAWQAYREKNRLLVGFDRSSHAMVLGADLNTMYNLGATLPSVVNNYRSLGLNFTTPKEAGVPPNLAHSQKGNFGPRLGFAYRALDGKASFVVRGGYSLSYFMITADTWLSGFNNNTPLTAAFNYNPNDAAQSPDGIPNYLLRTTPVYFNGLNDQTVIDLSQPRGITRGSAQASYFDPNLPTPRAHTWNFTVEKAMMASTVARARYVGTHSAGLNQWFSYNDQTPDYIWYMTTGQPLPTGAYANVARRPYDQQVLGTVQEYRGSGRSNAQSIDLEIERRFDKGYAYQLSYVMTNALTGTGSVSDINQFMPGLVPADFDQRNAFLNYRRDTGIPKHRVRWNWLVDLPVGKGKWLGRNAGKTLDRVIGGWQLAGLGTLRSNYFALPTGNWNFTGEPIQMYGYKYPIEDCRSGVCTPGYLWWNGHIPANQINSRDAKGNPNGYMGIPDGYKPSVTPLIPWPSTPDSKDPMYAYFGTNNVWIPLKNATTQRVGFNNGLHPWRNQYLPGVRQWTMDASLFKNVRFAERVNVRFSADFFNVLNMPGNPNSIGGDGFLNTRSSGQNPRSLQLSLRLSW